MFRFALLITTDSRYKDRYPTKKDTTNPATYLNCSKEIRQILFSAILNKNEPIITGIAAIKENLKASCLSTPLNRSVDIVIPDREIPGNKAKL